MKKKIEEDKETIKKNLSATSKCRLTEGIDFLSDITNEQPKAEKVESTRDWLFM